MDSKKKSKSFRLQTRLIFYTTLIILLLMGLMIYVVERRQSEMIQEEAKKRGMAIAGNLAAVWAAIKSLEDLGFLPLWDAWARVGDRNDGPRTRLCERDLHAALFGRKFDCVIQ